MAKIFLKPRRDVTVRGGNPWIFSGAIARCEPPNIESGATVEVLDHAGSLIGLGYFNPATTIAVRMLAWGETPPIPELIERRLRDALAVRRQVVRDDSDCYRLVNGDGDGLSGVVIDRYRDVLVIQLLTAGADRMRDELVRQLDELLHPRAILERSQGAVRKNEGLEDRVGTMRGEAISEAEVIENGNRMIVDFEHGQKTGYFLDQRENRSRILALSRGARVLDAYCYSGGFTIAALKGGATRVVAVETSARALELARRNLHLNGHAENAVELVHADAAEYLRNTAERFDVIVLDPPPLARSRKDADRAGHLYVELNALAIRALAPGGRLMTFSCSAHFRGDDFVHAVCIAQGRAKQHLKERREAGAAVPQALARTATGLERNLEERNFRILEHLGPGPDHPVLLGHGEGEYLTGLLLSDLG